MILILILMMNYFLSILIKILLLLKLEFKRWIFVYVKDYFGDKARIIGIDNNINAKYWEKYGFEIFIESIRCKFLNLLRIMLEK